MFFYDLPRFSIDLDFDLLNADKEKLVFNKVRRIILKYGSVFDEAIKYFGPLIVLDYGIDERKLKIEISNRRFDNTYEIKNLLGFNLKVMSISDMFAHKLCALLDRRITINRDIFDTWFFLQRQTPVNKSIIEFRMEVSFETHIKNCIKQLEATKSKGLLDGLGELVEVDMKNFVKTKLLSETIRYLQFYHKYPVFSE